MKSFRYLLAVFLFSLLANGAAVAASTPAAGADGAQEVSAVPLVIFNRTIFVFRGTLLGAPPAVRAARALHNIKEAFRESGDLKVTVKSNPEGQLVLVGDRLVFGVLDADLDGLAEQNPAEVAQQAAARLEQVIAETREARSFEALLKALTGAALATLVYILLLWVVSKLRAWGAGLFLRVAERKVEALKIGQTQILDDQHLLPIVGRLLGAFRWLVIALLTYEWVSFMLSRFPYTRAWGERLNDYLLSVVESVLGGIVGAVPGLGVAVAIFLLARFGIGFLGRLLERMSRGETGLTWLGPDTLPTTRRLFNIAIWLFAIAMAYPYLPGAQTEAFKGLSVLLGLMVSLGASSIVGQGAAGLILTYTRNIRVGEFVRISDHEGTVTKMGIFTTTIRTGLGEELTIPNSLITGSITKNYSRVVEGRGYVVDTTVTIGYDTPWRQVEAMLIEAARRTPGILETPAPRVFQTALSDYYPEYRLVAQAIPRGPQPRAEVLSQLHANIQDVFNEYGVQIMSPHYMGDTAEAKLVKAEDWYLAPARKSAAGVAEKP